MDIQSVAIAIATHEVDLFTVVELIQSHTLVHFYCTILLCAPVGAMLLYNGWYICFK